MKKLLVLFCLLGLPVLAQDLTTVTPTGPRARQVYPSTNNFQYIPLTSATNLQGVLDWLDDVISAESATTNRMVAWSELRNYLASTLTSYLNASYTNANQIHYQNTNATYAIGSNVQAAVEALDDAIVPAIFASSSASTSDLLQAESDVRALIGPGYNAQTQVTNVPTATPAVYTGTNWNNRVIMNVRQAVYPTSLSGWGYVNGELDSGPILRSFVDVEIGTNSSFTTSTSQLMQVSWSFDPARMGNNLDQGEWQFSGVIIPTGYWYRVRVSAAPGGTNIFSSVYRIVAMEAQ
jgi:hypothetical protein